MTLFGIDLEQDQQGKWKLFEVNGVNSGMPGFQQIDGDNRVEKQVWAMLKEKYGNIALNTPEQSRIRFRRQHPFSVPFNNFLQRLGLRSKLGKERCLLSSSNKALGEWIEEMNKAKHRFLPFPLYTGQKCTVFNSYNERLEHPTINPYIAEELMRNKLLQYIVLGPTSVFQNQIPTALVGLGSAKEQELENILASDYDLNGNLGDGCAKSQFVLKPICGMQSLGQKILLREEVERFKDEEGPLWSMSLAEEYCRLWNKKAVYLDHLVEQGDFSFEPYVGLIQPFVDTQREVKSKQYYCAVRAIVCNGQFIDAYRKYSKIPQVHFSHAEFVERVQDEELPILCERIAYTLLDESRKFKEDNFRQDLYRSFFKERGQIKRTLFPMRKGENVLETVSAIIGRI